MGNWVSALDTALQVGAPGRRSPRHRVVDNLIGNRRLCITVRKSDALSAAMASREILRQRGEAVIAEHDAGVLQRASSYLYTKETRSTFAIEHERPTPKRAERFVRALRDAARFIPDDESLKLRCSGQSSTSATPRAPTAPIKASSAKPSATIANASTSSAHGP